MAVRDIFKISRKTFFNPSAWIDLEALINQNRTIWAVLKTMVTPATPAREETFGEAMRRLQMSDLDVEFGASNYRMYALFFFVLGLAMLFYSFYLLFRHVVFLGFFLGIAASALLFAQAFKYDFWALQMRKRKLGLTFKDWKASILGEDK